MRVSKTLRLGSNPSGPAEPTFCYTPIMDSEAMARYKQCEAEILAMIRSIKRTEIPVEIISVSQVPEYQDGA